MSSVGAKCIIVWKVEISSLYETGILSAGGIPSSSCVAMRRDSKDSRDPMVNWYGAGPWDGDGSEEPPLDVESVELLLGIGLCR